MRRMRLAAPCLLLVLAAGSSASASSFPGKNGKLVYPVTGRGTASLFASNAGSSTRTKLTHALKSPGDYRPHFSADGRKIVFVRWAGPIRHIWIVSAAGRNAHQVKISGLPKNSSPWAPTFTPNGKRIIFELDKSGSIGIWKVPASGGTATQVMKGDYADPTVSPNGRKLAFISAGKLEIASITGANVKTVYDAPADSLTAAAPDFSPDGKQLAFALVQGPGSGIGDIAVVSSAGGTPTHLTDNSNGKATDASPAFAPNGTKIAFTHNVQSQHATWEIDAVPPGGGSKSVLVAKSQTRILVSVDWQPK